MARHLFEKHWYLRFWLPPHQFGCCFKKWKIGGGTVIKNLLARKVTYFIEISIPYLLLRIQKLCNKALLCRRGLQFNCFKRFSDQLGRFHSDTLLHVILQLFCTSLCNSSWGPWWGWFCRCGFIRYNSAFTEGVVILSTVAARQHIADIILPRLLWCCSANQRRQGC